jgi:hypothetical protein
MGHWIITIDRISVEEIMSLLFKIITIPFWLPFWIWKTSIKLAIVGSLILGFGGYFYFTYFM